MRKNIKWGGGANQAPYSRFRAPTIKNCEVVREDVNKIIKEAVAATT